MKPAPILLAGGSGVIGRATADLLRAAHPTMPFLIGGRTLAKVEQTAAELGNAQGVVLDPEADDFGLGERPVSAVAQFYADDQQAGLRFAQTRGVPHIGISTGVYEMAPEVAAYMHQPLAAPIVLGYEWLVGATTVPALELAKAFGRVHDITIGALVDEQDGGGPAVAEDFERLHKMMPAALTRRDGRYRWRAGAEAQATFRAIDGTDMPATGFSSIDVVGLATATGARNAQFNLASGVSSTRRHGEPFSTEILIELTGEDPAGHLLRTRHAVLHPAGAAPLTGLGVALLLERLLGLDGQPAVPAGLYFPYQLLDFPTYFARFQQQGGQILSLQVQ